MLWYKAWRESRSRFLLMLAFFSIAVAFIETQFSRPQGVSNTLWIYLRFYDNRSPLLLFFALAPPLLGSVGLLQERDQGTLPISLTLPLTRSRLVSVRLAVGLLEFITLCLVPTILFPLLSSVAGAWYPVPTALHFAFVWIVCGTVLVAMSFLFSTVIAGQYAPLTASILTILTYYYVTDTPRFFRFNMGPIVVGLNVIAPTGAPNGLPESFPWLGLSIIVAIAGVLFALAIKIAQHQDF